MSMTAIVKSRLLSPNKWSAVTFEDVLRAGDIFYRHVIMITGETEESFLGISSLNGIKNGFEMFGRRFSTRHEDDSMLYGSLNDSDNDGIFGKKLSENLLELFKTHSGGILTANQKSNAVMKTGNILFWVDSHSCDGSGKPSGEGAACILSTRTFAAFLKNVKISTGSDSTQYVLDSVDVLEII